MTDDGKALRERKRALRARMKERLAGLSPEDLAAKSRAVAAVLENSAACRGAEIVLAFLPLPGEADLRPLIEAALAAGKTVGLPRMDGDDLVFHAISEGPSTDNLVRHAYGVLEPSPDLPIITPEGLALKRTLVLVPGLAFDRRGGRLGRGKGFYDRFLAALRAAGPGRRTASGPPTPRGGTDAPAGHGGDSVLGTAKAGRGFTALGVGFACQLVDEVPTGTEDYRLDGVATEEGVVPAR